MAGPAPSSESPGRRALRHAFGVALAFVAAQLIGWPLAHVAPFLTAVLLQEAAPQSVRQGFGILGAVFSAVAGGFLIALVLLPYPAVIVLVSCVVLFRLFVHVLMSGVHVMVFIGLLIGFVVVPVLMQMLPEVAFVAGIGVLTDVAVAILMAWVAFIVFPASNAPPAPDHVTPSYSQAASVAATLTIVVAPVLIGFLVFGWTDILTLIYTVIFAAGMSSAASGELGWKSLTANLMYGGVGMILVYELLVMVPNMPFMIVVVFTACLIYSSRIFCGGPNAAYWASGFIGFLILLGGVLLSGEVVGSAKLFDRVFRIFLATAYVVFAYSVIDLLKFFLLEARARLRPRPAVSAG